MKLDTILSTLLSAAALLKEPAAASQALKEAYGAAQAYLFKKLGEDSGAVRALRQVFEAPYNAVQKTILIGKPHHAECETDPELQRLIGQLNLLRAQARVATAAIQIAGNNHHVQYAGRDLIIETEHYVRRYGVSPDERHLAGSQLEAVSSLIKEVAARIGGPDGEIKFAAVHRMLQRRFGVASYLLIPRECGEEAVTYLKQQRAILRSRLRGRDSAVYQNDLFRSIYAGAREMHWDRFQVYLFAAETLHLKQPLSSLKELSEPQLKQLCQAVRSEVGRFRAREYAQGCASQKDTF
jgi:hypothetical protein